MDEKTRLVVRLLPASCPIFAIDRAVCASIIRPMLGISGFRGSTVARGVLGLLHSADAFAKGGASDRPANHETASVKTNQSFRGCEDAGLTNMRQNLIRRTSSDLKGII